MQMLSGEADSFATGNHDIGYIKDLKMNIRLMDSITSSEELCCCSMTAVSQGKELH